jgi:hypothetical protein
MAIPRPRADVSWVSHFAASYATWLQEARSLLEAHQYAEAFKTYPWPTFAHAAWSPVRTPFGGGAPRRRDHGRGLTPERCAGEPPLGAGHGKVAGCV